MTRSEYGPFMCSGGMSVFRIQFKVVAKIWSRLIGVAHNSLHTFIFDHYESSFGGSEAADEEDGDVLGGEGLRGRRGRRALHLSGLNGRSDARLLIPRSVVEVDETAIRSALHERQVAFLQLGRLTSGLREII